MKNQFKPGDLISTNGFNVSTRRDGDNEMRGIILNMKPVIMPEPWENNEPVTNWRITLYITRNGCESEIFRQVYAVNTVKTLQIIDLERWSKQ
jgi:hypothetical protein